MYVMEIRLAAPDLEGQDGRTDWMNLYALRRIANGPKKLFVDITCSLIATIYHEGRGY
jgi:hypothetical protein